MEWVKTGPYWLTRFCFQRAIGFIYLIAFLVTLNQFLALIGEQGLVPVRLYLPRLEFWDAPGLFWINHSDRFLTIIACCGVLLSILAVLGISDSLGMPFSVAVWSLLWLFYLSFVNVGQTFYAFGWESLVLESGFLAIFLGSSKTSPPQAVMWLLRWVLFRVMFGAGLIKLRGDVCWRDLTCMVYHYETQPLPNPLSWYLHHLSAEVHKASVLFTHFVELIVPWGLFGPRFIRYVAGGLTAIFQFILILSGNLSWLNYLTLALCIACFDDILLRRVIPIIPTEVKPLSRIRKGVLATLTTLVVILSIQPTVNLVSPIQLMNASFEPLHLVNTYGAFGSVTKVRHEIILEGTDEEEPGLSTQWREYEFNCKPGDVRRRPCVVSPYHYRLDWLMWFAAMSDYRYYPWILNLVAKLLEGDSKTMDLLEKNPFPGAPPKYIRALHYRYRFTTPLEKKKTGAWWSRSLVGEYLRPLSLNHPQFREILRKQKWLN